MSPITIDMITALELFTNPYDLELLVGESQKSGYYAFSITRGNEHRGKPILDGEMKTDSVEDIISLIRSVLTLARDSGIRVYTQKHEPLHKIFNPSDKPIIEQEVLTVALIEKIATELSAHQYVSTDSLAP